MTQTLPAVTTEPFGRRFGRYLAERFPPAGFGPLIVLFTFSSVAYSRVGRGAPGFVPWPVFAAGALTALVFFFMLRVLDEHKDADVDRRYRPELPVPRGLVSLAELRVAGGVALGVVLALNALLAPVLLLPFLLVAAWAALMTREFFVPRWLRAHVGAYLVTHMAIMPLIDAYTTGIDWLRAGAHPPRGWGLFLAVTFLNGVVIEIGRKLHDPAHEREGVDTYSAAWGMGRAGAAWLLALAGSAAFAWAAVRAAGGLPTAVLLPALTLALALAALPAAGYLATRQEAWARRVETASQLWPMFTYVLLGTAPWLARAFGWIR